MNRSTATLTLTMISLTGCTPHVGLGENIGWNDAEPPGIDGIGREVEYNRGYKSLGAKLVNVSPDKIEVLESYTERNEEKNKKYKADANLTIAKAVISAQADYQATEILTSNEWSVIQLKDYNQVPLYKEFAYRCLTVKKFTYESSSKTAASAKASAGDMASKLGVTAASLEISTNPEKPNSQKVVVSNPNICLAFLSAKLTRARWWWTQTDEPRSFRNEGGQYREYDLKPGSEGATVEPDFGRRAKTTKPKYRLYSEYRNGKALLYVEIQDREMFQETLPKLLTESSPGVWSRRYGIHTYHIENNVYSVISMDLSARVSLDGVIHVKAANLFSPEYKLTRQ